MTSGLMNAMEKPFEVRFMTIID